MEAAITERTKAIVAVDIFGYPCELDELRALAERHGLVLIDDACEALGAEYKGAPLGSHGPSAVFAFYPNKQVATGEGGVVTTHSEEEWRLLRSLRNQGRSYEAGRWFHHPTSASTTAGPTSRRPSGSRSSRSSTRSWRSAREAAERYTELLAGVEGIETPLARRRATTFAPGSSTSCCSTQGVDRDECGRALAAEGIECGEYLPCIHLQPYMRERFGFGEGLCPVAEDASRRTLALPFFPQLEPEDQERVVDALLTAIGS